MIVKVGEVRRCGVWGVGCGMDGCLDEARGLVSIHPIALDINPLTEQVFKPAKSPRKIMHFRTRPAFINALLRKGVNADNDVAFRNACANENGGCTVVGEFGRGVCGHPRHLRRRLSVGVGEHPRCKGLCLLSVRMWVWEVGGCAVVGGAGWRSTSTLKTRVRRVTWSHTHTHTKIS
jgi:hypothetical protein